MAPQEPVCQLFSLATCSVVPSSAFSLRFNSAIALRPLPRHPRPSIASSTALFPHSELGALAPASARFSDSANLALRFPISLPFVSTTMQFPSSTSVFMSSFLLSDYILCPRAGCFHQSSLGTISSLCCLSTQFSLPESQSISRSLTPCSVIVGHVWLQCI